MGPKSISPIQTGTANNSTSTPGFSFIMGGYRAGRIINETEGSVTITFYERAGVNGEWVACADISALTIAANSSKEIPLALYASHEIALVLSSGTAALKVVLAG